MRGSAKTVNRANAKATVTADQVTAADLRAQTGRPHRPAGIRPINDQARLEKSITKVVKDKPLRAKTQAEIDRSRRDRLGRLARNEPATAAQNSTQQALEHHGRSVQGWVRAVGGSAVCPLCQTWADGVVRSTQVHMVRHKGCRCMQRPVAKKGKPKAKRFKKARTAAALLTTGVAGHATGAVAEELVSTVIAPGYYGRTGVLAGGRRAYRRLAKLESVLKLGGPKLAAAAAEKRRLIEAGIDVVRNTRDLEILDGGFLHHNDVYAFLDNLRSKDYTAEELDALWDYAGLYETGPGLTGKGPVTRYHHKLRSGERLTPKEEDVMRLVDSAIARNQTKRDVTVWRGALLPDEEVKRLLHSDPGERLTDKAPMFTGLTEARAFPHAARAEFGEDPKLFETHHGVMFKMRVPEGMPAMHSPWGEALQANPRRLPFLPRAVPGLKFALGRGARPISIPINYLAPDWIPIPRALRLKKVTLRIPFLDYFNKEELVLPRDTVMRILSTKIREDGLVEIEVDVLKPTLSPPSPRRAGKIRGQMPAGFPAHRAAPVETSHQAIEYLFSQGLDWSEIKRRFDDGEFEPDYHTFGGDPGISPKFFLEETLTGQHFLIKGGYAGSEGAVPETVSYRFLSRAGWNVPEVRVVYGDPPETVGRSVAATWQRLAETQYGPEWERVDSDTASSGLLLYAGGIENGRYIIDWIRSGGDPQAPLRMFLFDYLVNNHDRHFKNFVVIRRPDTRFDGGWDYRLLPIDNAEIGEFPTGWETQPLRDWTRSDPKRIDLKEAVHQTVNDEDEARQYLRDVIDRFKAVDLDAILDEMHRESGGASRVVMETDRIVRLIRARLDVLEDNFDDIVAMIMSGQRIP